MHFDEHLPPHFHALYGGEEAQIEIGSLDVRRGRLHPRALALVREWGRLHERELRENWDHVLSHQPPRRIPPL